MLEKLGVLEREFDFAESPATQFLMSALQITNGHGVAPVLPGPGQHLARGLGQLRHYIGQSVGAKQPALYAPMRALYETIQKISNNQGAERYDSPPEKRVVLFQEFDDLCAQRMQAGIVDAASEGHKPIQKVIPDQGDNGDYNDAGNFLHRCKF